MKLINLLPKEQQKELKLVFFSEQLIFFWFLVLTTLVFFGGITYIAKAYLSGQGAVTEGQIAIAKQTLKSSDNELLKEQVEGLNSQIHVIQNLQSQHYFYSPALVEFTKLLPEDISIDLFILDRASGQVDISGFAVSRESVLKFWADIHKSPYFQKINFPLANLDKESNDPFGFTFFVNPEQLKKQ